MKVTDTMSFAVLGYSLLIWFPLMAFLLSGCVSTAFSFSLWLRERAHFTVISAEMTRASRVRSPFGMVPWQDVWLLLRLRERAHFTVISADSARFGARPSIRIDSLRVRSGSSTVSWDLVRLVFFLWSDVVFPRRGFNTFRILFWILLPILLRILFRILLPILIPIPFGYFFRYFSSAVSFR